MARAELASSEDEDSGADMARAELASSEGEDSDADMARAGAAGAEPRVGAGPPEEVELRRGAGADVDARVALSGRVAGEDEDSGADMARAGAAGAEPRVGAGPLEEVESRRGAGAGADARVALSGRVTGEVEGAAVEGDSWPAAGGRKVA